jgi:hypothetical protein
MIIPEDYYFLPNIFRIILCANDVDVKDSESEVVFNLLVIVS